MGHKLFRGDWKNLTIHWGLYAVTLILFGYFFEGDNWSKLPCLLLAAVSLEIMLNHFAKWDLKFKHKKVRIDNYKDAVRITYDDGHSVILYKEREDVEVNELPSLVRDQM